MLNILKSDRSQLPLLACLAILMLGPNLSLQAQKLMTRTGHVSFFSSTPLEDIKADNHQVSSILNKETGEMVFALLMKSFQFEKALMQEHFNEKYIESDKFPKATFKGKILNPEAVNFDLEGSYDVKVKGEMTIHGVTRTIEAPGTFVVSDGTVQGQATFPLTVADYEIKIPSVVRDNIAKEVEVTVNLKYQPLQP